ncbi:MAG TPA: 1-acyl-sn-glycerol-3-phosphate acyltransferase, partial [Spirochaetota bacterium]|nr:1-acyl-sn-glycerol-3-phosphate acyltransferase [Spirochaetota bacterium]
MGLADIFSEVIEKMLAQSQVQQDRVLTPDNVFQEKHDANRTVMYPIVQKLLLEGSGIEGLDNLAKLGEIAGQGGSCLILAEHLSNFDVPVFWTLMHALGEESEALFDRIVFIAGRKLNEESAVVKLFTEMFTRIVISPKTFEDDLPDGDEGERLKAEAQAINMAAYRKIRELKKAGRIFLVYPTGTRFRPWEPSTGRGL